MLVKIGASRGLSAITRRVRRDSDGLSASIWLGLSS